MGSIAGSQAQFSQSFPTEDAIRAGAAQAAEEIRSRREDCSRLLDALEVKLASIEQRFSVADWTDLQRHIASLETSASDSMYGFPVTVICARLDQDLRRGATSGRFLDLLRMLKEERDRLLKSVPYCSQELLREITEFQYEAEGSDSHHRFFREPSMRGLR